MQTFQKAPNNFWLVYLTKKELDDLTTSWIIEVLIYSNEFSRISTTMDQVCLFTQKNA